MRCQWYWAHLEQKYSLSVSSPRCIYLRQWLPLCESSSEVSPFEQTWGAVQLVLQLEATFWSENQFIPCWARLLQLWLHQATSAHEALLARDYRSHGPKTLLNPSVYLTNADLLGYSKVLAVLKVGYMRNKHGIRTKYIFFYFAGKVIACTGNIMKMLFFYSITNLVLTLFR